MVPVACELVIRAGDVPVGVSRHGPFKSKTDEVYAIPNRIVVGDEGGERPQVRDHDIVPNADPLGIHIFDLSGRKAKIARLNGMRACQTLDGHSGARRGIQASIGERLALVLDYAVLHSGAGYNAY